MYCLGTGILTVHFIFYANGAILGILFLVLGASATAFVAMLVAECSDHYGAKQLQEIALATYGENMAIFTAIAMALN